MNGIGTEVPPRQGRRYRRHDGEDRDRSIAGALPSTRTRLERYGRRLKGERRRAKRWGGHVWLASETPLPTRVRRLREKLAGRKLQLDGIIVVARDWGNSETSSPFFQQKQTRLHRMRKIGFVYAFRTLEVNIGSQLTVVNVDVIESKIYARET
ncbi:hypothetical protein G5I_13727 [Acromyrmex echinatior]|uniref:Uncharacterized protein n=1 Tax=Acromyrmex echinatior TaxID=103372 RepID=F4X5T8_ACREC|nr:hypothetical protein G5I_13727 [Acromyrmex echinatior]